MKKTVGEVFIGYQEARIQHEREFFPLNQKKHHQAFTTSVKLATFLSNCRHEIEIPASAVRELRPFLTQKGGRKTSGK